jgi:hypothetical protein
MSTQALDFQMKTSGLHSPDVRRLFCGISGCVILPLKLVSSCFATPIIPRIDAEENNWTSERERRKKKKKNTA